MGDWSGPFCCPYGIFVPAKRTCGWRGEFFIIADKAPTARRQAIARDCRTGYFRPSRLRVERMERVSASRQPSFCGASYSMLTQPS